MKREAVNILTGIQKNTEMAMQAIDTLSDKVYDKQLASEMSLQAIKYAELHNRALKELVNAKAEAGRSNAVDNLKLKASIHYNTLLNTSTPHVAELMIKGNNMGILEMEKAIRHNQTADPKAVALAQELIHMEQSNIGALKSYL